MTQQDRTAVQYHKMTETPIPRLILSLAAPTILSMLITSIYNLADTFFVGRIFTSASGAVGVVSSLMAIIQALGFMLGHGSGTIISRRLGSQDTHAATRFASTSFFTALAVGVVLAVMGLATLPSFMMLLGSTETILPHACAYARPILLAAPLMISSLVMNNILRYEGKANLAMVGLVTGGLLNIALDPLFMFVFGLGTAGAGLATALSQSISFCILLSMFLRGKTVSQFRLSAVTREPREFLQILAGGAPSFGRQGLNSIGGMLLNIAARSYGDAAVAGMSIVSRIFMFILSVAIDTGQDIATEREQLHRHLEQEAERLEKNSKRRLAGLILFLTLLPVCSATYDGASLVKDYFGWESGTTPFRIFAALLLSAIVITSISVWHYRRNKS